VSEKPPTPKAPPPKDEPEETAAPTRRGFFDTLKKAAQKEIVRRTSTHR